VPDVQLEEEARPVSGAVAGQINAQDLWIGLGLDAKGVPSRVID
jgi:hypothetical protein